jgi:hypothetical protein
VDSEVTFNDLKFLNITCFDLQVFKCFYASSFGTWFVCCVFIICFGLGFMFVASESYFKSPKVSPLVC